ncbi:MAG: cell division protein SepF [Clostridia bacterium]|nr:cell division protein SepF [Clostridia bacterium]
MAFRDFTRGIKNFFGPNNRFFNGAREEDQPADTYYSQQEAPEMPFAAPQQGYQPSQESYYNQQQSFQQAPYQQMPYQQPVQAYQQPQTYQQGYQQPQAYRTQAGYQQPPQQSYAGAFQQQTVNQAYVPPRNRRAAQHAQAQENVVPFPGASAAAQPPVSPQQTAAPQQQANEQKKPSACVINVRNISDCRSAIGILRTGDCVIAVIDSIADQSEVRRYVDTLNGACFSLGCTMTRTSSRVGVYFLAPQGMQVLTDQTTTQMNAQSRAPQRPRSAQPVFQTAYAAPQTFAQHPSYNQYAAPQQQAAYTQPPQQYAPQQPQAAFTAQEPVQGYAAPEQEPQDYVQDAIN